MLSRKNILICLFILLLLTAKRLSAQDYECVSTDPVTGEITLNWNWPSVSSIVDHWSIQWSAVSGAWNSADSATFSNSGPYSYNVPSINGNISRYYFRFVVFYTNTSKAEFEISNIFLKVTPLEIGVANLNWNPIGNEVTHPGTFYIQRFENTNWSTISTLQVTSSANLSYNDTVSYPFCDTSTVNYRILFMGNQAGCNSYSNSGSGQFRSRYRPEDPINDTVSIFNDPLGTYTGAPVIGWNPSPERGIAGYVIYRYDAPVFITLDTISADSTIFIDKSVNRCSLSFQYAIAAIDSCGLISPGDYDKALRTILLNIPPISPCERKAYLDWTAYNNMPGGLSRYTIYRKTNSSSYIEIAEVDNTTSSFADSVLFINGETYTYYVRAFSANGTGSSTSCPVSVTYHGPVIPDTLYIEQASVVNNSYVDVKYYSSPPDRLLQLRLERADSPAGPFMAVDTLTSAASNFLPPEGTLTDLTADIQHRSYYYRLSMIDTCDLVAKFSENYARTILLICTSPDLTSNQLNWNEYSQWDKGVDHYDLYRIINGVPDPSGPYQILSGTDLQYLDDLFSISPNVQACYYIKASEAPGNPVIANAYSESNIACSVREARLFMPTAFCPEGLNNRFRPVQAFVDVTSFSMQIYSKWGQLIFETADIILGWDGNLGAGPAPADVYIYRIRYKSVTGESYDQRGGVTLVR